MFGLYQIIFMIFAIAVVGVLLGFKLAVNIHNSTLYILFWIMYFASFLSMLSILFSFYSYDNLKTKEGIKGLTGEKGPQGDIGDTGTCKSNCRDAIFYYELLEHCNKYLNKLEKPNGKPIEISNKYWKDRLTMIVSSKEYTNLTTAQGRDNTLNYIKQVLEEWIDVLYKAGGRLYFESIGAENEFEWRTENPWYEIKKYDMYYWGMNKMFKIQQFDKCRPETPIPDLTPKLFVMETNDYNLLWGDKHDLGRKESDSSFWQPKILTQNGRNMYPLGDIFVFRKASQDSFEGEHIRGHIKFKGGYQTGPGERTILVGGDETRAPIGSEYIGDVNYKYCDDWICRMTRYRKGKKRRNHFHIYKLIPPPGYKALGYVGVKDGLPILNNYRCLPDRCLNRVDTGNHKVLHIEGSARIYKFGQNAAQENDTKHLFTASPSDRYTYTIKDECLNNKPIPPDIQAKIDDPKYSKGWYNNPPNKAKKYSIMNYLALPTEAILVNKGNPKIFIKVRHITGQPYNTYHVIQYSGGPEIKIIFESKLEAINPQILKWKRDLDNFDSDTFRWTINNDETNRGEMTILSEAHNKYLRITHNRDIKLVHHNAVDRFAYWKIHG